MDLFAAARFRLVLARYAVRRFYDHRMVWLAARLPHELTDRVLAHVVVATLRRGESPGQVGYMDIWKSCGRAAKRHPKH